MLVLLLDCPETVLEKRLLGRATASGRFDDNVATIRKRFQTFSETSTVVIENYRKEGKVVQIDSSKCIDEVYSQVTQALNGRIKDALKVPKCRKRREEGHHLM